MKDYKYLLSFFRFQYMDTSWNTSGRKSFKKKKFFLEILRTLLSSALLIFALMEFFSSWIPFFLLSSLYSSFSVSLCVFFDLFRLFCSAFFVWNNLGKRCFHLISPPYLQIRLMLHRYLLSPKTMTTIYFLILLLLTFRHVWQKAIFGLFVLAHFWWIVPPISGTISLRS